MSILYKTKYKRFRNSWVIKSAEVAYSLTAQRHVNKKSKCWGVNFGQDSMKNVEI